MQRAYDNMETEIQLTSSHQKIAMIMPDRNSDKEPLRMQEYPRFSVNNKQ